MARSWVALMLPFVCWNLAAADNGAVFRDKVLPILLAHCESCHGGSAPQNDLSVSNLEDLLRGGKHGPAIAPGSARESLLIQYVRGERMPRMPLGQTLDESQIQQLAEALDSMAPQAKSPAVADDHWGWLLSKPEAESIPKVKNPDWVVNPIDAFILANLESKGLHPAPEADRRALIRRVYFDLIGLPPAPDEVRSFLYDSDPESYGRLIDRLLDDPRYGERWARHWLDLVRYAESNGFATDIERPTAWRYRDYVIRSFNRDKPFDLFIKEQLAGDELEDPPDAEDMKAVEERRAERFVALGFLRLGPWEADANSKRKLRQDFLNEITGTTGSVFLGVTVGCAQCHDHKYDPISQKDFYRMQAFFAATRGDERRAPFFEAESPRKMKDRYRFYQDEVERAHEEFRSRKEELVARFLEMKNHAEDDPAVKEFLKELTVPNAFFQDRDDPIFSEKAFAVYMKARDERDRLAELLKRHEPLACSVSDLVPPEVLDVPDTYLLAGGELDSRSEKVNPGFPERLTGTLEDAKIPYRGGTALKEGSSGRRLALAEWIASPEHPLTARVMVNRLWQHHFGQELVRTPSDFGINGERPTHPELLDWLAVRFVEGGWSLKAMHKLMLTSQTYRQSTEHPAWQDYSQTDPDNRYLWRMNWNRLEAEVLRDSILALSGRLNQARGGPSVLLDVPQDVAEGYEMFKWFASEKEEQRRRTIYTFQRRSVGSPFMQTFDGANMGESCARRSVTTVAPQALTLLNGKLTNSEARHFAKRVLRESEIEQEEPVERAFWLVLSRPPSAREKRDALKLLARSTPVEGLTRLSLVLFNLSEFLYLE